VRALLPIFAATAFTCSKPAPPTLVPERVTLTRIDATGIALDLALDVSNPNLVDLTTTDVTSHLVVDKTRDVGTVTLPNAMTLAASKTTRIDVPMTLSWPDMSLLAQLAMNNTAVPYSVDGSVALGGSLLQVHVPFHFDGSITRDQIVGAMMNSFPKPR